jgi:copper(I)-binding protein
MAKLAFLTGTGYMKVPGRRTIRRLPALLAVGMLAGCGSQPPLQDLPGGGVDATTGPVVIDDIWVDAPAGLTAGADAPLRLTMTNRSTTTGDALVGVTTPVAERAVLLRDGRTVPSIALPAATQTNLEWLTSVELDGLRRNLRPGERFPVTLTFSRAAPVTVQVAAGPLAAPATQAAPPTQATPATLARQTTRSTR